MVRNRIDNQVGTLLNINFLNFNKINFMAFMKPCSSKLFASLASFWAIFACYYLEW